VSIADEIEVAVKHHAAGQLAEAEAIYRHVLERDPAQSHAMHQLGILLHESGRTAEGTAFVERALTVLRDPAWLANLGELLRCQGKLDRGIACCREAIERAPRHVTAHLNLAVLLNQAGRSEEALPAARKAVELAPDNFSCLRVLSAVLTSLGQADEATAHAEAATRANPSDGDCWNQLAAAHKSAASARASTSFLSAGSRKPGLTWNIDGSTRKWRSGRTRRTSPSGMALRWTEGKSCCLPNRGWATRFIETSLARLVAISGQTVQTP